MAIKFNSKVERHSMGIKDLPSYNATNSAAAHDYLAKQAVLEHTEDIDRRVIQREKEFSNDQAISNITKHKLLESQIPMIIDKLHKTGREMVFKEIMFEMFTKSLYLDEDFVLEKSENIRSVVNDYVDKNGGYALLEQAFQRTKSPYLKKIMVACESVSSTVAKRKLIAAKEGKLDVDNINFDLNPDEEDLLTKEQDNLSIDQLSDLVKSKVLNVIKDEKQRQQKEQEIYDDLQQQSQPAPAPGDGSVTLAADSVNESLRRSIIGFIPIEEGTLFNSLFRHSYKEALQENVATVITPPEDRDDEADMFVNTTEEDVQQDEFQPFTKQDSEQSEYSIEDEIDEYSIEEDDDDNGSRGLDMDLIMAEAVTKYTLLELAHTIKLEDHNYQSVQKISQHLLN